MARMRRLRRGRNSNIFNGKRIVISTSQGGSEGQALHNNIIRGIIKTDFIQSRSTTDKMIHTVNVNLKENTPGEFATEEAFSETVSRMNNYSFPYYKTSYSIPRYFLTRLSGAPCFLTTSNNLVSSFNKAFSSFISLML